MNRIETCSILFREIPRVVTSHSPFFHNLQHSLILSIPAPNSQFSLILVWYSETFSVSRTPISGASELWALLPSSLIQPLDNNQEKDFVDHPLMKPYSDGFHGPCSQSIDCYPWISSYFFLLNNTDDHFIYCIVCRSPISSNIGFSVCLWDFSIDGGSCDSPLFPAVILDWMSLCFSNLCFVWPELN